MEAIVRSYGQNVNRNTGLGDLRLEARRRVGRDSSGARRLRTATGCRLAPEKDENPFDGG